MLCKYIADKNIEVISDNITAIAYINYKGVPSAELSMIARQFCNPGAIFINR